MSSYLLADDLSGALEAGAAFRSRGWRVTLPLEERAPPGGAGELRVITTESRNLPPGRAAEAVRRAVTTAGTPGAQLLFKKIDSTMRGPIGAELKALIAELAPPLAVFCPANPAAGRTVRQGVLRVYGVPLAATDFRSDPLWPASESRVSALLTAQGVAPAGQVALKDLRRGGLKAALGRLAAVAGTPLLVIDAETDADLELVVKTVRESAPGALLIGSGALAAGIARELPAPDTPPPPPPRIASLLILCGSGHPASQRQLDYLAEKARVTAVPFVPGKSNAQSAADTVVAALASRGVAAVRFASGGRSTAGAAAQLLAGIADFAALLLQRVSPDALFLTGGETAWTVCRALRGRSLEVLAELAPGIVMARLSCHHRSDVYVITKPGGFGTERAMVALFEE